MFFHKLFLQEVGGAVDDDEQSIRVIWSLGTFRVVLTIVSNLDNGDRSLR